jgi:hypothetical protein
MPNKIASIIKAYKVYYAPYATTEPAFNSTSWIEVPNTFKSLPNFFPAGESIDISSIDGYSKKSTENEVGGADEYVCPVYFTSALELMHFQMHEDKIDPTKGYTWIKIEYPNRGKYLVGKFTSVRDLPTPEGELGNVDEIDFTIYSQEHTMRDYSETLRTLVLTSVAGSTQGSTAVTIDVDCPSYLSSVYKTAASIDTPVYDAAATGYTPFAQGIDITATTDNEIAVAYVDRTTFKIKYWGKTTVVSKA